ncbi:response regulator [Paraurantiacibacter namhicola]|uniref:Two-component response regulator n=1 Tax=Paraurantiacibacter namhicola TaxID=645517 RepID=A0A1C7D9W5_9SPHN|nr:response regulator [Paraurantiacibacter namhicola]ANU08280.1 two-component response regulator [Paraurantiacibacter namhicola]
MKPRILLLEDEPLILMDLELSAEDLGCEPVLATRVDDALDVLEKDHDIAVAVLDFTLPENCNCIPVARELERRAVPYLLHSGDLDRLREAIRSLDAPIIPKPANGRTVIERAIGLIQREPQPT